MRPRGAVRVLLAGLLTGGVLAAGATPVEARPEPRISARLAPPVLTVGEPAAIVAQLASGQFSSGQPGRTITVQRRAGNGTWAPLAEGSANASGRAVVRLDTAAPGTQVLRLVAPAWNGRPAASSPPVTLKVLTTAACSPRVALVDPAATTAARCLAARLDRWKAAGLMGVGQQLNTGSVVEEANAPLAGLGGRRVSVIGFDLWELGKTRTYEFPFYDQALANLVTQAQDGAVLTASWHTPNPRTGGPYNDRSWRNLGALLADSPEAATFWAGYAEQLAVLAELQAAGVAVVFRPFHEVNGDWFWWGRPKAAAFRAVYAEMQERAWAAGVHNVVWAYSFNAVTGKHIADPVKLLPKAVDLAGIDSYWPSTGSHRSQAPSMAGYAAVAKRVPRMAVTEVGPLADPSGSWKPTLVTATARGLRKKPVWALLWVDDAAGRKQISSLAGGLAWLDSCPNGLCSL